MKCAFRNNSNYTAIIYYYTHDRYVQSTFESNHNNSIWADEGTGIEPKVYRASHSYYDISPGQYNFSCADDLSLE